MLLVPNVRCTLMLGHGKAVAQPYISIRPYKACVVETVVCPQLS